VQQISVEKLYIPHCSPLTENTIFLIFIVFFTRAQILLIQVIRININAFSKSLEMQGSLKHIF